MDISVKTVGSKRDLKAFIEFPKQLYRNTQQWVPFFDIDYRRLFARRHPFFDHAEAEMLLAQRGDETVGRAMVIRNGRYNEYHQKRAAHFYFFDYVDDYATSAALVEAMRSWARKRNLTELTGPLFMGASYGGGALIEGFEYPAAMTMMPYNHRYYRPHYEQAGFEKHFDLYSLYLHSETFHIPERVERAASHVRKRGRMQVLRFGSMRQLKRVAPQVASLYNETLADHGENYPLSERELSFLIKELVKVARPDLEKVITYDGNTVGYLLGFPDLSQALRDAWGRLTPRSLFRLWRLHRNADRLVINGMGILEKYQRLGGNALMYSELARSTTGEGSNGRFRTAEMLQINEETELMLADLRTLGAEPAKVHRVFTQAV